MYLPIAFAKHISDSHYYVKKIHMIEIGRCPDCNEPIGIHVARFFDKVEEGN